MQNHPRCDARCGLKILAVLARARRHLASIVAEFQRNDSGHSPIPFRAVKVEALNERSEVLDVLALTRALLHPADRVAWLAILRAPWVGFSLEDLASFFENKPGTIWQLIQNIPSLERLRRVLDPANRMRGSLRRRR